MQALTFLPSWAWIIVSGVFFALGEFFSKKFVLSPGWSLLVIFLVVDILSALTWLPAIFEKSNLSVTGVIWSVVSVMATVAIGILVFGEKLTIIQSIGLFLGLIAVALLSL
jgi:multidrug transporter EmrE-like cation transporter